MVYRTLQSMTSKGLLFVRLYSFPNSTFNRYGISGAQEPDTLIRAFEQILKAESS
jgi:hypothetical protein